MKKPILVVMAAGMGSRYGGLKQIDPVGKNGEIIMDFSVFDAVQAGFSKVIFIIKEQLFEDFKEVIGDRVSKYVQVEYVFQKLDDLPEGFTRSQRQICGEVKASAAAGDEPFTTTLVFPMTVNEDALDGDEDAMRLLTGALRVDSGLPCRACSSAARRSARGCSRRRTA